MVKPSRQGSASSLSQEVLGRFQVLPAYWTERLSSLLAVSQGATLGSPWLFVISSSPVYYFFLRFYLFILTEAGGRERINVWLPLTQPLLGDLDFNPGM